MEKRYLLICFLTFILGEDLIGQKKIIRIPDDNFRKALLNRKDIKRGIFKFVFVDNISKVKYIDISNKSIVQYKSINNLKGIESFTSLTSLNCSNNQLTTLDVSHNPSLTSLNCYSNKLTTLDVSNNLSLTRLACYNNQLTTLNVENCYSLKSVSFNWDKLANLKISHALLVKHIDRNTDIGKYYKVNPSIFTESKVNDNQELTKTKTNIDSDNKPYLSLTEKAKLHSSEKFTQYQKKDASFNLKKVQKLKKLYNSEFSVQILKNKRDKKLEKIVDGGRGEFETNDEYALRRKENVRKRAEIEEEFKNDEAYAREQFTKRKKEIKIDIEDELRKSRESFSSGFWLGKYDIEKRTFPIIINRINYHIKVQNRDIAKIIKKKSNILIVHCYRQMTIDENWEYFDWELRYDGMVYPFGPRKSTQPVPDEYIVPKFPPNIVVGEPILKDPNNNNMLDAEETIEFTIPIKNDGEGTAYGLAMDVSVTGSSNIRFRSSHYIGNVSPGKSTESDVTFYGKPELQDGKIEINFNFNEKNGFPPDSKKIEIETIAFKPPRLVIKEVGVDDDNDDGIISVASPVDITVRLKNEGVGNAFDVRVKVEEGIDVFITSDKEWVFPKLEPYEERDITFSAFAKKVATAFPVSLTVTESRGKYGINNQDLGLDLEEYQSSITETVYSGEKIYVKHNSLPSLTVDVDENIPIEKKKHNALGIIIGIEKYEYTTVVDYARRDAKIMEKYFIKTLGIQKKNIKSFTGEVNKSQLETVFHAQKGWLKRNIKKLKNDNRGVDIYVYYAGHGAPDIGAREGYLVPSDCDPNYLEIAGYSLKDLYRNLSEMGAKSTTVFLDACFSGVGRDEIPIFADARSFAVEIDPIVSGNITVFSAASGAEYATPWHEKKHGLFTYYLMKGLRGKANSNKDKELTVRELESYLKDNVSEQAIYLEKEQNPFVHFNDPNKVIVNYK